MASRIWKSEVFRAAAVLTGLLHICFFPAIWGDRTLLLSAQEAQSVLPTAAWGTQVEPKLTFSQVLDPGAPAWYSEPTLALIRNIYRDEKVAPLWNPYQAYGTPLAAAMQSQPFFPLTAALLVHLGPRTYNWFVLGRLLVAGLGMFLYLRYFVSFPAALCGGIATLLGGYYIVFINMPHLSVDMLLPVALWAGEYLLRNVNYRGLLQLSGVVFLLLIGGMPETAALILIFTYLYFLFRIFSDGQLKRYWQRHVSRIGGAAVSGIVLSAFLILPFLELLRNSFNVHEEQHIGVKTGLIHDPLSSAIFTYLFPLLFGPPITSVFPGIFTGLRNYFGLIPLFLLFITGFGVFWWKKETRQLNLVAAFFGAAFLFVVLKRFGFGPVNIVGSLPVLSMIYFTKYDELILTVSIAVLTAAGIEYLYGGHVRRGSLEKSLFFTFLVIPLTLVKSKSVLVHILTEVHVAPRWPLTALAIPVFLLFVAMLVVLHYELEGAGARRRLAKALIFLVGAELCCNFVLPAYTVFGGLAYDSRNPFRGAPFVDFLRGHTRQQERVFGRDLILHPDWASAFQLCDVRDVDALYYRKYFPFLHAFLPTPGETSGTELGDRFRGEGEYRFATPREQRFLQLSSVKYIAGTSSLNNSDLFVTSILKQNAGKIEPGKEAYVRRVDLIVDGLGRTALQEHPPYKRLPYELTVPNQAHDEMTFWYTIDPAVWNGPGDGVDFRLEVQDAKGETRPAFAGYIDPKHNPSERRWMEQKIDLTPYHGQTIRLLLSTDAGPKGDSAADWADWAGFQFENAPGSPAEEVFKPVYAKEAQIVEYGPVLPRAALFHRAELRKGERDVLKRLADPSLNIFSTALLDASQLSQTQMDQLAALAQPGTDVTAAAATITRYESRKVEISAATEHPALLVLNDSDFPGWTVEVDGKPEAIVSANYLFRGVFLSPGRHTVRFIYEPVSFRAGTAISLSGLILLAAGYFLIRRRECIRMEDGQVPFEPALEQ